MPFCSSEEALNHLRVIFRFFGVPGFAVPGSGDAQSHATPTRDPAPNPAHEWFSRIVKIGFVLLCAVLYGFSAGTSASRSVTVLPCRRDRNGPS
jgi:hypothetical protein